MDKTEIIVRYLETINTKLDLHSEKIADLKTTLLRSTLEADSKYMRRPSWKIIVSVISVASAVSAMALSYR